jgi:hypothetical protein
MAVMTRLTGKNIAKVFVHMDDDWGDRIVKAIKSSSAPRRVARKSAGKLTGRRAGQKKAVAVGLK